MSLCASVYMCFVVTCWERADLLALVCGVYCESVTFPLVSWVRCGTWLYRFLIFAPLLTFTVCQSTFEWIEVKKPDFWEIVKVVCYIKQFCFAKVKLLFHHSIWQGSHNMHNKFNNFLCFASLCAHLCAISNNFNCNDENRILGKWNHKFADTIL